MHDLCQDFTGLLWNPVKQDLTSIPWNPSGLKLFENANEQVEDRDPCVETPLWSPVKKTRKPRLFSPVYYVSSSFQIQCLGMGLSKHFVEVYGYLSFQIAVVCGWPVRR